MTADCTRSLAMRFVACGHPFPEAERPAGAIATGIVRFRAIAGNCPRDAGQEPPVVRCRAGPYPVVAARCGTVPAGVDRDGILFHGMPDPAAPAGNGERGGLRPRGSRAFEICW
jgi:hypothetical protein